MPNRSLITRDLTHMPAVKKGNSGRIQFTMGSTTNRSHEPGIRSRKPYPKTLSIFRNRSARCTAAMIMALVRGLRHSGPLAALSGDREAGSFEI